MVAFINRKSEISDTFSLKTSTSHSFWPYHIPVPASQNYIYAPSFLIFPPFRPLCVISNPSYVGYPHPKPFYEHIFFSQYINKVITRLVIHTIQQLHRFIEMNTQPTPAGAAGARKPTVKFLVVCGVAATDNPWCFGNFVGVCRVLQRVRITGEFWSSFPVREYFREEKDNIKFGRTDKHGCTPIDIYTEHVWRTLEPFWTLPIM